METASQVFCAAALTGAGDARQWAHLMPAGSVLARDGRRWTVDAEAVVAHTIARSGDTDIVIDYEHQSQLAGSNGQPAPAAGWIEQIEVRADGIWGHVRWTERAREMLKNKEYRYISPTFLHNKSGSVEAIVAAALTNLPALDLAALAKTHTQPKTEMKFIEKLAGLLGLAKDADEGAALTKVQSLIDQNTHHVALAKALAIDTTAKADEQLAAAKALVDKAEAIGKPPDPDPAAYVPREEFTAVAKTLAGLQTAQTNAAATAAVDQAVSAGKVTPATRSWAERYAQSDLEGFLAYCQAAPMIIAPGEAGWPLPQAGDNGLAAHEISVCKMTGVSQKAYLAQRDDAGGGA